MVYDVIIVGGGFAGLSASCCLKQKRIDHIVFEKGRIGESWRSQRWDSFRLNSTNQLNLLPGMSCDPATADQFSSAPEFVESIEQYAKTAELPVIENATV
ncbi:MAG TPA: NAD(P)-binding domain-containing protein, partial [Chitinophagaceae bacterium]